jgi:hypothetical protein
MTAEDVIFDHTHAATSFEIMWLLYSVYVMYESQFLFRLLTFSMLKTVLQKKKRYSFAKDRDGYWHYH